MDPVSGGEQLCVPGQGGDRNWGDSLLGWFSCIPRSYRQISGHFFCSCFGNLKNWRFFQEPNRDSDRVQGDCGDQAVPVSSLAQDGARNFLDCLIVPRGWGLGSHCAKEGTCHPQIMRPKSPCGPKEGQWVLPVHRED